ncbi:MAG TPA: MFS transporter, partial [Rhizobacter sp.]|nr:MFS transporter [Rhizobacter sp.]
MTAWLLRRTRATAGELAAVLWSFVYFFALLAGYYVLRPIRDEMGLQLGARALQELFTAVFVVMLLLVPVFGWLNKRFPRRQLLPWLYGFFALNLVGFFAVFEGGGTQSPAVARAFFVWVAVYNFFIISLFWSFMADLFDTEQAKRLYGVISAGGTLGALTGPLITVGLVKV